MGKKSLFLTMLALALSVCVAPATADVTTGLVGYWPLDGDTVDASGNGANGTINGPVTPAPDREGTPNAAMRFDGGASTNINVGNPSHLRITGEMTLAAWVSLNGGQTNNARIVSKAGGSGNRCWSLNIENDVGGVRYPATFQIATNGTTNLSVLDTQSLPTDEWVHMTGVYRPSQATEVYVNGELRAVNTTNIPATQFNSSLAVLIGNRAGASNCGWIGMIDDVRIYARALTVADIMELVYGQPGMPSSPEPADGKDDIPVDAMLSWTPGEFAVTHDIYLGKDSASVDAATVTNPMGVLLRAGHDAGTIDPGRLEFGTTYYWRVDEVNGPPDHTVYQGPAWSFTTEPVAYPITNVQATASSNANADAVPANLVNKSGLTLAADGSGEWVHGTVETTMWQSASPGLPATVAFEFDQAYKLYQMKVWNHNTSNESFFGLGAKEVTIEVADSNEGPWTPLADVTLTQAPGTDTLATDTILMNGVMASNVRLTIRSNYAPFPISTAGLAEVQFFYLPVAPRELTPANGAALTGTEVTLAWRSGREAAEHRVYLDVNDNLALVEGSDPAALATTVTAQGAYGSYTASGLNLGEMYAWKIVEVNAAETPATHESPVMSFTTPAFELVDDMETYKNVEFKEIWATWLDGTEFGTKDPTNGSVVGADPYGLDTNPDNNYDAANVGRGQSLPIWFTNTAAAPKSEAIRNSQFGNWTQSGIKSLSLWFRGDPANTGGGRLYVKINNGNPIYYDGDPTDLAKASWQPFNIDLSKVAGALTNVTKLAVGVDGIGAKGVVYIDDIRLYPRAPEYITPVQPDTANLLAYYDFESNANDRSGHNLNGQLVSAQLVTPGKQGMAVQLDGTGHVDLGNPPLLDFGTGDWAVTAWFKTTMASGGDTGTIFAKGGDDANGHRYALGIDEVTDGAVSLTCDDNVTKEQANATTVSNDDQWHFVAGQRQGDSIKIYIDGQLQDTESVGATYNLAGTSQHKAYIGTITNNADGTLYKRFVGSIDEVRVYNRALSEAEILGLAGKTMPVPKPF